MGKHTRLPRRIPGESLKTWRKGVEAEPLEELIAKENQENVKDAAAQIHARRFKHGG